MKDRKIELHAIIHGRVQGVFFRKTTRRYAKQMGIVGTVANLFDGTVEIYAQGRRDELEVLLRELSNESGPGHVTSVDVSYTLPIKHFEDFRII